MEDVTLLVTVEDSGIDDPAPSESVVVVVVAESTVEGGGEPLGTSAVIAEVATPSAPAARIAPLTLMTTRASGACRPPLTDAERPSPHGVVRTRTGAPRWPHATAHPLTVLLRLPTGPP